MEQGWAGRCHALLGVAPGPGRAELCIARRQQLHIVALATALWDGIQRKGLCKPGLARLADSKPARDALYRLRIAGPLPLPTWPPRRLRAGATPVPRPQELYNHITTPLVGCTTIQSHPLFNRTWWASSKSGAPAGGHSMNLARSSGVIPWVAAKKRCRKEPSAAIVRGGSGTGQQEGS